MIKIKGFNIIEELHNSNSSVIYRAINNSSKEKVILKALKSDFPNHQELFRYKQEYEITNSFNIDGVIKSHNLIKFQETHILVFEDFDAISLNKLYKDKLPNLREFFLIAIKITNILSNIHRNNIIHKDINPSNIVINPVTKELKIIDFGISKNLNYDKFNTIDSQNNFEGTSAYMSPEQTGRINRVLDYRSDFYSLGLTFYELLNGSKLYESIDSLEMSHFHIAHEVIFSENFKNNIPNILIIILKKMIEKDPEKRYQSAWGIKYDFEKCFEMLENNKSNYEFTLGINDISNRFCISSKLYGRENEKKILFNSLKNVINGGFEFVIVSGYSGSGKTSLIHELQYPHKDKIVSKIIPYFCKGKFEQFMRNIPYSAISQACSNLIKQVLSKSEKEINQYKTKLINSLGSNIQIIIDLVPELKIIIQEHFEIKELNSRESKNRLDITFKNFINVFCSHESPVIFFLDDLQWSDIESLNLIQKLVEEKDINYFLLVGSYRDNEIANSPLSLFLNEIEKYYYVKHIHIESLNENIVNQLIGDSLYKKSCETIEISKLICNKTNGNPFFVRELLNSIYEKGILSFNFSHYKWEWDLKRLESLEVSDNILDFILKKLKTCSENSIDLLKIMSCIGNTFSFNSLILFLRKPLKEIILALFEVIKIGIVIPLNNFYLELQFVKEENLSQDILNLEFQFRHDRIQKAAYLLNEKNELAYNHLLIGKIMLKNLSKLESESKIIDITQHFNNAKSLIRANKDKIKLARLNLKAGKKAKLSAAYISALEYFSIADNLLTDSFWESNYVLAFDISKSFSECAYICGYLEIAEKNTKLLLSKSRTDLEKAEIYHIQTIQYTTLQKHKKAIEAVKKGLSILGINLENDYSNNLIIEEENLINKNLGIRQIEDIINDGEIKDYKKRLIIKLFHGIFLPTYSLGHKNLLAYCILKAANFCLKFGNTSESAYIFNSYAFLRGHFFGDLKTAYRFGQLSMALNNYFDDSKSKAANLFTNIVFVQYWNTKPKEFVKNYKRVIEIGLETGDLIYTSYACSNVLQWDNSINLQTSITEGEKYLKIIKQFGFQDSIDVANIFQNLRLNFINKTDSLFSLSNEVFNEKDILKRLKKTKNFLVTAVYHIYKIQPYFHYDNFEMALYHINQAELYIDALAGQSHIVDFTLFSFLTYCALYSDKSPNEKDIIWKRLEILYKQIKIWSENMPDNFLHLQYLMEAEMARIKGQVLEADKLYRQSINLSEINSFLQHQAIANELASKLWININDEFSILYLKKSCYLFELWGSIRKVQHLCQKYNYLTFINSEKANSKKNSFDVETIIKSSQTLLNEKNLSILLEKMMKLIIENAGAETGILLLPKKNQWFIEAIYNINSDNISVLKSILIEEDSQNIFLSNRVLYYTIRSGESVVINNVNSENIFNNDTYIINAKPLSILCIPLINQGSIEAVLYLENKLSTDVFTESKMDMLNLLLSQASISIKNTILYQEMENLVKERTKDLLDANSTLKELNYEKNEMLDLVTHNLRSPLGSIIGFASSIKTIKDLSNDEIDLYSAQILLSGKRMLKMIRDLLDINTIESGKYKLNKEDIDIFSFIEDLLINYSDQLKEKRISISLKIENRKSLKNQVFILNVDEEWFAQIIDNLVSNAIKFSPYDKNIVIELISKNKKKQIKIIDEGQGISDKDQTLLFKKFARLSSKPTNGETSSGLGLSIVKKMVEIMDGQIYCDSQLGKGSTFIVEF